VSGLAGGPHNGFTLVELLIACAITITLASIASALYAESVNRTRVVRAMADVRTISGEITVFLFANKRLPDTLDEVGIVNQLDPWGTPYQYLLIEGGSQGLGAVRKDHKLNPLNADFDLYSMGRDRLSKTQISIKDSLDDVIRANNGAFVGLASDY